LGETNHLMPINMRIGRAVWSLASDGSDRRRWLLINPACPFIAVKAMGVTP
jgi:hypothetical protein